jgi:thiamine biosynthesis lipoprotein
MNFMAKQELTTVQGFNFDTYNTISACCDRSILEESMKKCDYYNNMLSKTVPDSDVWRINHAGGKAVRVNSETVKILSTAARVSADSGGAFNISIGGAMALWRFTDGSMKIPDKRDLAEAIARADYTKIQLGEDFVEIPPDMQIDLGGIAKGYIVDSIANELRSRGVKSALLNFGGDVVTIGQKPDGNPWMIGLQTPEGEHGKDFWAVVKSVDSTVVTSGVYERGFDYNGVRYHHILDPRTGWPVQNGLSTVTICAQDSMLADALTTAIFVLGVDEGMRLAQKYGVQAVFLSQDGSISFPQGMEISIIHKASADHRDLHPQ